jgi:hypothetical protein
MPTEVLSAIAQRLNGKTVKFNSQTWVQEADTITVPEDDEEGLLHEILHFIVASHEEREWPNLALDEEVAWINPTLPENERLQHWVPKTPVRRETQVAYLTHKIFALRGWRTPRWSSVWTFNDPTDDDKTWADEHMSASGTSLEELAAALVTGRCRYGYVGPDEQPTLL